MTIKVSPVNFGKKSPKTKTPPPIVSFSEEGMKRLLDIIAPKPNPPKMVVFSEEGMKRLLDIIAPQEIAKPTPTPKTTKLAKILSKVLNF